MSLGLPVVASAVGGTPELVKHGLTGYLVENFEVETISSYLKILLCDDDLRQRMGNTARIVVREHFGLNEMVERYRRLYEAPYSTITGGYHE
jgi:glycosyltransferase involved in cell wall biosynthesis